MQAEITDEVAALAGRTNGQLAAQYERLFGSEPRSRNKQYLIRRIAWRLQALAEGGLSQRARERAKELADEHEVRTTPPGLAQQPVTPAAHDQRLPGPGGAITKAYKGRTVRVIVLSQGFEYDGQRYRSLSAVARAVSGSHCNGFRFFGLEGRADA